MGILQLMETINNQNERLGKLLDMSDQEYLDEQSMEQTGKPHPMHYEQCNGCPECQYEG